MPIRNQINDIVTGLVPRGEISFLYGTRDEINVKADSVAIFPLVCVYPLHPVTSTIGVNGSVHNSYDIYCEFLTITEFEKDTNDNAQLVADMLKLSNLFLSRLNRYVQAGDDTPYFTVPKGTRAQQMPIYWSKDANLTGVSLSIKVDKLLDDYLPC